MAKTENAGTGHFGPNCPRQQQRKDSIHHIEGAEKHSFSPGVLVFHMIGEHTGVWNTLRARSAAAFMAAGGFWLADTVYLALELSVGLGTPEPVAIKLAAVLAAVVGVLGLYPGLADQVPRLARAGLVLVAVPGAVWAVLLAWGIGAEVSTAIQPPPIALVTLIFLPICIGVLLYGSAGLYTGVPSRAVGFLLLAHVAILFAAVPATGLLQLGLVGGLSGTFLATGTLLRFEGVPSDQETPAGSPAAR